MRRIALLLLWLYPCLSLWGDAVSPTHGDSHDASAWDATDGAQVNDVLSCVDDNDVAVNCVKQGKSPDDVVRVEFPNLSTLTTSDTVTVTHAGVHNYTTMALVPYSSATGVDTTNKITDASLGDGEGNFTLTSGFITALFDQGSGTWAARVVEDGEIDGDVKISEVDSNLTTDGVGNQRRSQTIVVRLMVMQ